MPTNITSSFLNWNNKDTIVYEKLNAAIHRIEPIEMKSFIPKPSTIDYEKGYIPRYFIAKNWKVETLIEVSVDSYNSDFSKLNKGAYSRVQINWYINGNLKDYVMNGGKKEGVLTKNRKLIEDIKKTLPGIVILKNNLLQFYKSENLYTNGGEYALIPGGPSYVGLYHITPGIGPMIGPNHTKDPHPILYPLDGSDPAMIGNSLGGTI
jgi:hypothetical protein